VVPDVLPEFSTGRVLTLSFEEGLRLSEWLKSEPSPESKEQFARLVLNLIVIEFFHLGMVQTDPNYGNFMYRPATGEMVLLDFGATYPFDVAFRESYRRLAELALIGSDGPILEQAYAMRLLDVREDQTVKELLLRIVEQIVSLFLVDNQPIKFGNPEYLSKLRQTVFEFVAKVRLTPPARDTVFLNRKLGGMFHLLKDLGAELDLMPFWQSIQKVAIKDEFNRLDGSH